MAPIKGIIFDKDGTLFSFADTWVNWALDLLDTLSEGDEALKQALADAIDFDLSIPQFRPTSVVIAGTVDEIAEVIHGVTGQSKDHIKRVADDIAAETRQVKAPGLEESLTSLAKTCSLGVMTNDSEVPAKAHLASVGIESFFDFVAGYDSGYGAKPAPEPLLAFCETTGLTTEVTIMVGDSRHDLLAGRAAGMRTVGVLTGVAAEEDLRDLADVILPDVSYLPGWVASQA